MSALAFTQLFLFFLFSTLLTRFWLAARQWRNVNRHRNEVPEQFAGNITLDMLSIPITSEAVQAENIPVGDRTGTDAAYAAFQYVAQASADSEG